MKVAEKYKQTEVGLIPSDWEVKTIKGITTDMLQGVNTAIDIPEYVESGYPMLKANNIIGGEVNFSTSDHISEKTYQGYSDRFKIKKDDFLFSNIGARLGTGSLMKTNTECSFAWNVMRIIPNQKIVKPEFLGCIMNSPALYKEIKKNEAGSGMGFVPKNVLQNLTFPIPKKLEEQTTIATALSDADALISGIEKLIAKKRNIKQGAMQRLLQPKEGWEVKRFKEVFIKFPAKNYQINSSEYEATGKFPIIDQGKKMIVAYSDNESKVFCCPKEGVIIFGDHTRILKYVNYDFIVGADGTQLLSCEKQYNTHFVFYLLLTKEIPNTGYNRHFKFLLDMEFCLPQTKEEQTRIATILSDMDAEISALETKLEKNKKVKLGMMQNLLTGKIRLV